MKLRNATITACATLACWIFPVEAQGEKHAPREQSAPRAETSETAKNQEPGNKGNDPGYRFVITGDFNGDGKKERLVEHFVSRIDNKEASKFHGGQYDYDRLVDLTMAKNPVTYVESDDKSIARLHITSEKQQFGLAYLKNEGDLDGDGADELSYVVNWADWSSINTWHIMTYKNGKWCELYSFDMWDWLLPDLPRTASQYGLFGLMDKATGVEDESINEQLEKELHDFEGLVKKIGKNKIRIVYMNEEGEKSSKLVRLTRLKSRKACAR